MRHPAVGRGLQSCGAVRCSWCRGQLRGVTSGERRGCRPWCCALVLFWARGAAAIERSIRDRPRNGLAIAAPVPESRTLKAYMGGARGRGRGAPWGSQAPMVEPGWLASGDALISRRASVFLIRPPGNVGILPNRCRATRVRLEPVQIAASIPPPAFL